METLTLSCPNRHPGFEHHPSDDVVRVAEEIGVSAAVVPHAHCLVMVVRPQKGHIAKRQEQTAYEKKYVRAGYRARRGRGGHLQKNMNGQRMTTVSFGSVIEAGLFVGG